MSIKEIWHRLRGLKIDLDIGEDRNILLICLGIAFFFWLIVKLSKEYDTHKHVTTTYLIPDDLAFREMPPDELIVEIQGTGWDLIYEYFITGEIRAIFDLSRYRSFDIKRPEIESRIKDNLSSRAKITDLDYAYLQLDLEDKVQKKVPILFQQDIKVQSGFQRLGEFTIHPDSVVVIGPESLTDTISSWSIAPFDLPSLKSNFEEMVALKPTERKEIMLDSTEVLLVIPVEQLTEKSFFIPIHVKNSPDSLKIFPDKIRINSTIGLSEYNSLQPDDFVIEVDLKEVSIHSESNTVPLFLVEQPDYIKAVHYSPKSVEFFIVRESKEQ